MTKTKTFLNAVEPPPEVVGPERILEIEERVHENEFAREKASGVREEKVKEIAALKTQTPQDITATIARERRSLLAKVALGSATDSDLAEFDRDAAEKQRAVAKQTVPKEEIKTLEETVAGLDDEIKKLDALGKGLIAERDRLWCVFLRECAEQEGAAYKRLAGEAFGAMLRVVNYGAFVHRLEGYPNEIGLGAREFAIPSLKTESTKLPPEKHSTIGIDTNLFSIVSDANRTKFVDPVELQLFEEFKKAGLKWPARMNPPALADAKARVSGIGEGLPVSVARPPEPLRTGTGEVAPSTAVSDFDAFTGKE